MDRALMKYLLSIFPFLLCLACEGGIPLSSVEGPAEPGSSVLSTGLPLPRGNLSSHPEELNTTITDQNIHEAAEKFFSLLLFNLSNATDFDTIIGALDQEHAKFGSGMAVFEGSFKSRLNDDGMYNFKGDYSVALNNWTVDGEQYFGGGLKYDMSYYIHTRAYDAFGFEARVSGEVELNGTYRGRIAFRDFSVFWGAWVDHFKGELTVYSNGNQFHTYLYKYCQEGKCEWIENDGKPSRKTTDYEPPHSVILYPWPMSRNASWRKK